MLTSRLIDRPLRPMFAPGWHNDTQVRARQLSARLLFCMDLVAGLQSHPHQRKGSNAWQCAGAGVGAQLRWHQLS